LKKSKIYIYQAQQLIASIRQQNEKEKKKRNTNTKVDH